jgi:hypothetical protein
MGVERGLFLRGKNISYKCPKAKCPRKYLDPKQDKEGGQYRTLNKAGLGDLYSSPRIFRTVKSESLRRVGHEVRMGRGEMHTKFW